MRVPSVTSTHFSGFGHGPDGRARVTNRMETAGRRFVRGMTSAGCDDTICFKVSRAGFGLDGISFGVDGWKRSRTREGASVSFEGSATGESTTL